MFSLRERASIDQEIERVLAFLANKKQVIRCLRIHGLDILISIASSPKERSWHCEYLIQERNRLHIVPKILIVLRMRVCSMQLTIDMFVPRIFLITASGYLALHISHLRGYRPVFVGLVGLSKVTFAMFVLVPHFMKMEMSVMFKVRAIIFCQAKMDMFVGYTMTVTAFWLLSIV